MKIWVRRGKIARASLFAGVLARHFEIKGNMRRPAYYGEAVRAGAAVSLSLVMGHFWSEDEHDKAAKPMRFTNHLHPPVFAAQERRKSIKPPLQMDLQWPGKAFIAKPAGREED